MEDASLQVAELIADNERLSAETADQQTTIDRLSSENARQQRTIESLEARIAKLEAQLAQNSSNSSKPPSSDSIEDRKAQGAKRAERRAAERAAAKTARRPGKQPGDPGHHLARAEHPDRVVTHSPGACVGCGADLGDGVLEASESRQVYDLCAIKAIVTEHVAERRRCGCGVLSAACFPPEAKGPTCWGPNVQALGVYLVARQHIPIARAAEFLSDACGAPVSTGWLAGVMGSAAGNLDGFMTEVADGLASGQILHLDETGARIAGVRHWFHVASTDELTYLFCHKKRGNDAIRGAGILPRFRGTAVHDCWAAYLSYEEAAHQLCGAHLLRELAAIVDDPTHEAWAADMTRLLLDARSAVQAAAAAGQSALSIDQLSKLDSAYIEIAAMGMAAAPDPGKGLTWWALDRKAYNLAKRLGDRRHQVLAFTRDFSVPFTNYADVAVMPMSA